MALETFVSIDIHQALGALDQLSKAAKQLQQAVNIKVTADTQAAATALDNIKNRVQQVADVASKGIKIKVDVGAASQQVDGVIRRMRSLQKASAAIKVQTDVKKAVEDLQRVLEMVRELKNSASIVIDVQVNGQAVQMLTSIHKQLVQLNGAGVNWSHTQQQMTTASKHWYDGLKKAYKGLTAVGRAIASVYVVGRTLQSAYHFLFDFSNQLEQTGAGLTTVFDGNQMKAERLLGTLKEFAKVTPFSVSTLAPLTQQALAFELVDKNSKTLEKDITSLFTSIGNAAYGLGRGKQGIESLVLALGQMHTATKVTGQGMLQLQRVGVNAWKYLSQATGKSTAEVQKLVSEGLIPADEAIQVILQGINNDFGGGMARGAQTMEGILEQLGDTFDELKSKFTEDLFSGFKETLSHLTAVLNSEAFEQWSEEVMTRFKVAFAYIGSLFASFLRGVRNLLIIASPILAVLGARFLVFAYTHVSKSMAEAGATIGKFVAGLPPQFTIALMAVAAFSVAYSNNFLGVKTATDWVAVKVLQALKWLSHGVNKGASGIAAIIRKVLGWIAQIPDSVTYMFGTHGAAIRAVKKFSGAIDNALSFDGLEKDSDKQFDGWIKGLQNNGGVGGALAKALQPAQKALTEQLNRLNPLAGFGDMLKKAQQEAAAIVGDPSNASKEGSLLIDGAKTDAEGKKATAALKKHLSDAAKYWDDYSKRVESAARQQIDAIKGVADSVVSLIDDLKKGLLSGGILNDPLQPTVNRLMRHLGLGEQATGIAAAASGRISTAGEQAQRYRDQAQRMEDSDKSTFGGVAAASEQAAKIAQSAMVMQSRGATRNFAHLCQRLARVTVQRVTRTFDRYFAGTASATMKNFQRAGIGFAAGKNYRPVPGDLVYTDGSVGRGAGHVQTVDPRGFYNDQYGSHAKPTTRPMWIVRPGGAKNRAISNADGAGQMLNTAAQSKEAAAQSIQNLLQAAASVPTRGSKVFAVPQQWLWAGGGTGVADAPDSQARFKIQQWLSTQTGHDWFEGAAARTQGGRMAVAQTLRQDANAIDVARNTANIKVATKATDEFVKKKTEETRSIREGSKWLRENSFNAVEYGKAMDIAKARTEAEKEVRESGIPIYARQEQVARRVQAATVTLNAQLRSKAFTDHRKRVADLDLQYKSLGDTTLQQIATRKVLSREDAAYLSQQEKQLEIAKEIRNEQAQFAQKTLTNLRSKTVEMQFGWEQRHASASPVEQLRQQFQLADRLRRQIDPDYNPSWDVVWERIQQLVITTEQWNFDSAKQSLDTFNGALKDTELTTAKVAKLIEANRQAVDAGTLSDKGLFSEAQIDQLFHKGTVDELKQRFSNLANEAQSFSEKFTEQMEALRHADEPLYSTRQQLEQLRRTLADAKSEAIAKGVYDDLARTFDVVAQSLDAVDLAKLQQLQRATEVKNHAQEIFDNLRTATAFTELDKWRQSLRQKQWTDEEIESILPAKRLQLQTDEVRGHIETMMSGISNTISGGFKDIFENGPKHFFRNLLDGLASTLNQMATQILTSAAMKYLMGGAGGLSGGDGGIFGSILKMAVPALAGAIGGGGGGNVGQAMAGLVGGDAALGPIWLASGMPTVPYDGMPARLHKDEAVLTAAQAQRWRSEQREMARMPRSGGGGRDAGGVTMVNQYHIGTVVANNPQEFTRKIPGQRTSNGEMQRALAIAARQGGRRL